MGWDVQALTVGSVAALSLAEGQAVPLPAQERTNGQAAGGLTRGDGGWVQVLTMGSA